MTPHDTIMLHVRAAQVSGDARAMRRQMRDRALAGLDKLEVLQRSALSGGPMTAPSLAGDLPAPSEAGAAPGTEEEFHYQPTKVRCTMFACSQKNGTCARAAQLFNGLVSRTV